MSSINTPLTELLGCDLPVIQTAMGWIADANLVTATTQAGGFGFLAGAVMTPAEVRRAIEDIRQKTHGPFGVNFHMYQPGAAEIIDICIELGVKAVSYSRSPDAAMIAKLKTAGIKCIPTVGALKHAVKAVQLGADAVVVQGGEGGGHTGTVASNILLPQVVDAIKEMKDGNANVPVVAAGGFKDGRGLCAALSYGAAGIAMGTRFLLTQESPVPDATKAKYVATTPQDIIVSKKLDGLPQRMINNLCLQQLEKASSLGMLIRGVRNGLAFGQLSGASITQLLTSAWRNSRANNLTFAQTLTAANSPMMIQEAMVRGHPDDGILPSGQIAGAITDLPSVAELMEVIYQQTRAQIERLAKL